MASSPLRLLFLLPFAPRLDAAHGGGRVVAQFLAQMVNRHQVALICFHAQNEPPLDDFFLKNCAMVEEVDRPWSGKHGLTQFGRNIRILASLAGGRPLWVTDYAYANYARKAQILLEKWQPDIIQIEFHVMGQYLDALKTYNPVILTEHEPGRSSAPYLRAIPPALNRLVHYADQLAWKHFEPTMLARVDTVVVFTHQDQQTLEEYHLTTPIRCIPFGTPLPDHPLNPTGVSPANLLFIGNFIHPPNVEGALHLARDIFPAVLKEIPEVTLTLVGDQPPQALCQLAGDRIQVTGLVPDVTPYMDRTAMLIAPLMSGGGMRVKVLEALAFGKVVVASPLAVEGLAVTDSDQLVIAKNDAEMITRITQLLLQPEQRLAIAGRARAWACANLTWERSIESYELLYESLRKR